MPSMSMVFDVLAIDRASQVFDRVGASAERAGASVEAATTTTSNAGSRIAAGVGIAGAAVVALSVKMAGDFQQNVTKLATTAGEAQNKLGLVSKGMLDMSVQVGIGANELAKGMYTVESAGFHGANALTVLKAAAQGARQEQADLGKTTDALTTILHDYNIPASESADVMSKLVTAVSTGKTTLEEFTGSLHSVTPLAAALHVPLSDILGDLAAMTASGESADQATQNMADALRHLQSPTATMTAELAQIGITSSDLAASLSTKGLAGSMQEIEQAILQHVDPATRRVLLPAFNQSKTAAADLAQMIGSMPPALAKLSQGLLGGSVSISEYQKSVKGMGGEAGAAGLQFLSLFKTSDGFNQVLKQGGPAAQVFTSALQKSVGDVAGLTVALQLTGEHAGTVNDNIKKIAASSAEAGGNIKGWHEVQGNFNQQLAETGASLQKMAIELGQHLLPALTDGLHFINGTVIPGVERMGSAVGGVVHWFSELPGPVKDAALALAALRLADMVGLFDRLGAAATRFRENMALQAALGGMEQASAGAEGGVSRLGAAMGVASRAAGGLRGAASGLVGMFGGPWGLALVGATLGITALMDAMQRHDAMIQKATQDVQKWNEAIAFGGGGQTAVQAAQHIDDLRQKLAEVTAQIDKYNAAAAGGNARGGIGTLISQQNELRSELDKGSAAWKAQLAAMSPVQEAQIRVAQATQDLGMAEKHNAADSQIVTNAHQRLAEAEQMLAVETGRATDAQKSQLQEMQDSANALIANANAQTAAVHAQTQFNEALTTYRQLAGPAADDQATLSDAARNFAQSQADAAVAQAKANGVTDTGTVAQVAYLKALQDAATQMGLSTPASVSQLISSLQAAIGTTGQTIGAFQHLGAQSDEEKQKLIDLGKVIVTLPDGSVVVTADTHPAQQEIVNLLNYARQQSITYRATLPDLNGSASGSGRPGLAAGGWVRGAGTGTSDSVPIMGSNGEFMVNAAAAQANAVLLEAINAGHIKGFASGGWVGLSPNGTWPAGGASIPVSVQDAGYMAGIHNLAAQMAAAAAANAPGAPSSVQGNAAIVQSMAAARGWTGAEWNALYALVMRESGFRNTAQNPTSTAYGMFQFLDSTWAAYGGGKTSDPRAQTRMGLDYIAGRYHDPLGAWGHETKFGWYDNGGWLQPGLTMAYNGTGKPERVSTAEQSGASTVIGVQNLGPVSFGDGAQVAANAYRYASMAAARFR